MIEIERNIIPPGQGVAPTNAAVTSEVIFPIIMGGVLLERCMLLVPNAHNVLFLCSPSFDPQHVIVGIVQSYESRIKNVPDQIEPGTE